MTEGGRLDTLYSYPEIYDAHAVGEDREDLAFYRTALEGVDSVLELGCGTGRLTLPLAESGVRVLALDAHEAMLASLRERLRGAPAELRERVTLRHQDFRQLEGVGRHDRVFAPFSALAHCGGIDELLSVFEGAREALLPGGLFAFDLHTSPRLEALRQPGHPHGSYDWLRGLCRFTYGDVGLTLRIFSPDTLVELLERAGLELVAAAGDFLGGPLQPESLVCILVARRSPEPSA